jgi:hypothetical protein
MDRSRRQKKEKRNSSALKSLRKVREQGLSRTEEYEVSFARLATSVRKLNFAFVKLKDEGDVFEEVTQQEYEAIVQQRREENEFVVDDGVGYFLFSYRSFT